MSNDLQLKPIFLHSMFRAGSTYIFNKFRSADGYTCFQEPFNEALLLLKSDHPEKILEIHHETTKKLRHADLDKPYFEEFYNISGQVSDYICEENCYRRFFEGHRGGSYEYIQRLVELSAKRPFIQFCRSSGRVGKLGDAVEVLLWRSPREQWWSYKVDEYFSCANLMILNSDDLTPFLRYVKNKTGVPSFDGVNIELQKDFYLNLSVSVEDNYFIFYSLWCLNAINKKNVRFDINIDALSFSDNYRNDIYNRLSEIGVNDVIFDDADIADSTVEGSLFYENIENKVHSYILEFYGHDALSLIKEMLIECASYRSIKKNSIDRCSRNDGVLRDLVLSYENKIVEITSRNKKTGQLLEGKPTSDNRDCELQLQLDTAETLLVNAEKKIQNYKIEICNLRGGLAESVKENENLEVLIKEIYSSRSWMVTQPIRWIANQSRRAVCFVVNRRGYLLRYKLRNYEKLPESRISKEILVDITLVHQNDLKTGIQRVVRAIFSHMKNDPSLMDYGVSAVYLECKGEICVYRYVESGEVVVPKKEDIFIGADLNASILNVEYIFTSWSKKGVRISFIVYDILPILYPQWWSSNVSRTHRLWLEMVLMYSENLLCISQSVMADVNTYTQNYNIDSRAKIDWFNLGYDIENSLPTAGVTRDGYATIDLIKNTITFLMVGTIEPRKGHDEVFSVFTELWENDCDCLLVIVGKYGWKMDEFVSKVNGSIYLNDKFHIINDASDEYLEMIYSNSTCLIAASYAEGFGLPLIEAANNDLPIIARDIPVFREVAGNGAYYFDGSLGNSLALAIVKWITLYEAGELPDQAEIRKVTWKDCERELLGKIIQ